MMIMQSMNVKAIHMKEDLKMVRNQAKGFFLTK
jgi:hypothetical protein